MAHASYMDRLEEARKRAGCDTLQEFLDRLNEAGPESIPYATARRYHKDGREPPVSYLVRVTKAFPEFRLDYLAAGDGELTHTDTARVQTLALVTNLLEEGRQRLGDQVGHRLKGLPAGARDVVTRLAWDLQLEHVEDPVEEAAAYFPDQVPGNYGEQMARVLAHAQVAYLAHFGSEPTTDQEGEDA